MAVHRGGGVAAVLVRLSSDRVEHLQEPCILVDKGVLAKYVDHVQNIVPDKGSLELSKVGADAEQVELALTLMFPVPEDHLGPSARGRAVHEVRDLGQCFQGVEIDDRAWIVLATRPAEPPQVWVGDASPAILVHQAN